MVLVNVNVADVDMIPQAGADSQGRKKAIILAQAKATADDTLTITNASSVVYAIFTDDTTGVLDPVTITTNVIVLTGSTTGTVSGEIYYK